MPLIYVDPNTLDIKVTTKIDEAYITNEETVAIKLFAESVKKARDVFLKDDYNPKIDQLMKMVMKFNSKFSPEVAKKYEEMFEKKPEPTPKPAPKAKKKKKKSR